MTIVYAEHFANAQDFAQFWRLILRWKGSLYQALWPNLLIYVASYFMLSLTYRFLMTDEQRYYFEQFAYYTRMFVERIQVPFFLGFFVTQVYKRWWNQFFTLPWPDGSAVSTGGHMDNINANSKNLRKQIARYVSLSFAFLMRTISPPVAARFKRRDHFVKAGLLTENEALMMRKLRLEDEYRPHWVVCMQWSAMVAAGARLDGSMPSDEQLGQLLDTLSNYTDSMIIAYWYNWINIPLDVTQIVTWVVYSYYFFQLIGKQYLSPHTDCIHQDDDDVFPLYLFTQYFFFVGWLKTSEVLINPFGEDDEDMDINQLIDRNFEVTAIAADNVTSEPGDALHDWYWSQEFPDSNVDEFADDVPLARGSEMKIIFENKNTGSDESIGLGYPEYEMSE